MLNELEIIFFLHIIEETKWQFDDAMLNDFASQFNYDFLNIVHEVNSNLYLKVYKPDEYKRLILYLVCCAYAIKGYLNENADVHFINVHLNQFVKLEYDNSIERKVVSTFHGFLEVAFYVRLFQDHASQHQ